MPRSTLAQEIYIWVDLLEHGIPSWVRCTWDEVDWHLSTNRTWSENGDGFWHFSLLCRPDLHYKCQPPLSNLAAYEPDNVTCLACLVKLARQSRQGHTHDARAEITEERPVLRQGHGGGGPVR